MHDLHPNKHGNMRINKYMHNAQYQYHCGPRDKKPDDREDKAHLPLIYAHTDIVHVFIYNVYACYRVYSG